MPCNARAPPITSNLGGCAPALNAASNANENGLQQPWHAMSTSGNCLSVFDNTVLTDWLPAAHRPARWTPLSEPPFHFQVHERAHSGLPQTRHYVLVHLLGLDHLLGPLARAACRLALPACDSIKMVIRGLLQQLLSGLCLLHVVIRPEGRLKGRSNSRTNHSCHVGGRNDQRIATTHAMSPML